MVWKKQWEAKKTPPDSMVWRKHERKLLPLGRVAGNVIRETRFSLEQIGEGNINRTGWRLRGICWELTLSSRDIMKDFSGDRDSGFWGQIWIRIVRESWVLGSCGDLHEQEKRGVMKLAGISINQIKLVYMFLHPSSLFYPSNIYYGTLHFLSNKTSV